MRLLSTLFLLTLLLYCKPILSQDIAIAPASNRYKTSFGLRKIFIGNNYRRIWSTPVTMPVFYINEQKGGLTITRLGGGAQTKSLRMVDKDSIEWVLRTVDKNVKNVLPKRVRKTFITAILQDIISTAHPYAPLVVASLAKALNLNTPDPELFFVLEDSSFGKYRNDFANKVCYFERVAPTRFGEEAVSSDSMFNNLSERNDYAVEDTTFLKIRLLDMLIGDWDRHKDQYKWGWYKRDKKEIYYPIARDRDQAFFYSDGIILQQARLVSLKFMRNFKKRDKNLVKLNERSWLIDKILLNKISDAEWRRIIADMQQTLSDTVLETAVKKLPPEIYEIDGKIIFKKLKNRRDDLMEYGMAYYKFLTTNKKLNNSTEKEKIKQIMKEHPGKH